MFLLITRVAAGLRLSRREEMWKTAEILILRHQISVLQRRQPPRPKLDWADRALLAALLGVIPKARCQGLPLLITPDTIVRWHRDIARRRQAARSMPGRTGRPATRQSIRALVRRLARENPGWGYRRIHGELAGLGIKVAASTVWEILKASGIDPGRRQTGPTWSQFLRSQAEAILACDFFTCATRRCMTEWRWKDSTAGQSQLAGEAEGSRNAGTRGTVGAALTTTGQVGIIRRPGSG